MYSILLSRGILLYQYKIFSNEKCEKFKKHHHIYLHTTAGFGVELMTVLFLLILSTRFFGQILSYSIFLQSDRIPCEGGIDVTNGQSIFNGSKKNNS